MLKYIFFVLCASTIACAQRSFRDVTATLPQGVAARSVKVVLRLNSGKDGIKTETPCPLVGNVDNDPMFECGVDLDQHSTGVFLFTIPGYKPYSIKFSNPKLQEGIVAFSLGAIHPGDADEPRIDSVASIQDHGATGFRITVNNLSSRQILVAGMRIDGSELRMCGAPQSGGHMPPNPSTNFRIADRLLLAPSAGDKAGITATIADPKEHPDFPLEVVGAGVSHPCSSNNFKLSAPMNFEIPAKTLFEIRLMILPGQDPSGGVNGGSSADSPISLSTAAVIKGFSKINFTLLTANKDHPELLSTYP